MGAAGGAEGAFRPLRALVVADVFLAVDVGLVGKEGEGGAA